MEFLTVGIIILAAFILGTLSTKLLIPILKRKHTGQNIREEGPQSHLSKAGTPSMGGLAILFSSLAVFTAALLLLGQRLNYEYGLVLTGVLVFGALGFWDDFIKILKKHNLGLRAWQKLAVQILAGFAVAYYMAEYSIWGTTVFIPFINVYADFGVWYVPFIAFAIVAMSNSVNLTDGLDGLASGVTALVSLFFAIAAYTYNYTVTMSFCAALCGACLGFLVFNRNPAKVFMGDTGSLALGGGLAVAAIVSNLTLLLPVAGFVYVMEALSVMLQVASFKLTGKRIFKMAPIHHHFELCGMKETQVVKMFWLISMLCCILGFVIM